MATAQIINDDWTMGKTPAIGSQEIYQNVKTRIRSFKNDWFLDADAEIDWFNILAKKNNKSEIIGNIKRVVLQTAGVLKVNYIKIDEIKQRKATISVGYTDIYNQINDFKGEI